MTSFKSLNDEYEFSFLKNIIFEMLRTLSKKEEIRSVDLFINHFDSYISELQLFTLSFCEDKMNEVLWAKYANDKKGYALGFSNEMFVFKKKNDLITNPDWPLVFLKVKYGEERAKKDMMAFIKVFLRLLKDSKYKNYENYAKISFLFAYSIFSAMPRYKKYNWEAENEYRFYMMDQGKEYKIPIQEGIKPAIEGVTRYLSEIIIGKDASLEKEDIEKILETNGYDLSRIIIMNQ